MDPVERRGGQHVGRLSGAKSDMVNLLLCSILTLAALSPPPEITGTIVDYQGKPGSQVSVAVVSLNANRVIKKTLSASDGSFSFTGLAAGGYGVAAKTDSACAFSDAIQVDTGFTDIVRLRLAQGLCDAATHFAQPPRNRR
jgi:5-hydroxyisourate hydrolase-like protein (transthyretin family)